MSENSQVGLLVTLIARLNELQTVISVRAEGNGSCGECGWLTHEGHSLTCWAGRLLPLVESVTAALPPAPPQAQELEELRAERDQLLAEMRANPKDYPNLLRINREYASRCEAENDDLRAQLAASPPAQAQEPQCELCRNDGVKAPATICSWHYGQLVQRIYEEESKSNGIPPAQGWQPGSEKEKS